MDINLIYFRQALNSVKIKIMFFDILNNEYFFEQPISFLSSIITKNANQKIIDVIEKAIKAIDKIASKL